MEVALNGFTGILNRPVYWPVVLHTGRYEPVFSISWPVYCDLDRYFVLIYILVHTGSSMDRYRYVPACTSQYRPVFWTILTMNYIKTRRGQKQRCASWDAQQPQVQKQKLPKEGSYNLPNIITSFHMLPFADIRIKICHWRHRRMHHAQQPDLPSHPTKDQFSKGSWL